MKTNTNSRGVSPQHTPGPWAITGHDGRNCTIVECEWGSVALIYQIGCNLQERANARLIAAAPELLGVAQFASGMLADIGSTPGEIAALAKRHPGLAQHLRHLRGAMLTLEHKARAAIAKAEGNA